MQYYDQHMHTYYSFDSEERFENYLKVTDKPIITTEHLDMKNPYLNYADNRPDYQAYATEIDKLNESYNNRLLKGIEVGYTHNDRQDINDYLMNNNYDLIIMSIHQNGVNDYMDKEVLDMGLDAVMDEYFGLMLEAVENFKQGNILAHFEYGLRLFDVTNEDLERKGDIISAVFEKAIANDMALELNSKSMYAYGNAHLYDFAIPLYQSLGGKLFTLGSDAHKAKDYGMHFEESLDKLRNFGVKELTVYQKQMPILVELPDKF